MLKRLILISLIITACGKIETPVQFPGVVFTPIVPPVVLVPKPGVSFAAFSSSWGLKKSIYDAGMAYFAKNSSGIKNKHRMMFIDFSLHASKRRLFVFNLDEGTMVSHNVAAGKNSDPDGDGYATVFSNVSGSNTSSLGFYKTAETYIGSHGLSLKLDGLEATNSKVRERAIVMHPANYVTDGSHAGRSFGCPAIDPRISAALIGAVKGGAILYIAK